MSLEDFISVYTSIQFLHVFTSLASQEYSLKNLKSKKQLNDLMMTYQRGGQLVGLASRLSPEGRDDKLPGL